MTCSGHNSPLLGPVSLPAAWPDVASSRTPQRSCKQSYVPCSPCFVSARPIACMAAQDRYGAWRRDSNGNAHRALSTATARTSFTDTMRHVTVALAEVHHRHGERHAGGWIGCPRRLRFEADAVAGFEGAGFGGGHANLPACGRERRHPNISHLLQSATMGSGALARARPSGRGGREIMAMSENKDVVISLASLQGVIPADHPDSSIDMLWNVRSSTSSVEPTAIRLAREARQSSIVVVSASQDMIPSRSDKL